MSEQCEDIDVGLALGFAALDIGVRIPRASFWDVEENWAEVSLFPALEVSSGFDLNFTSVARRQIVRLPFVANVGRESEGFCDNELCKYPTRGVTEQVRRTPLDRKSTRLNSSHRT